MDDGFNPVSGAQVRPLFVYIEDGRDLHPALRVRPDHHHIPAVGPRLRPVGHSGGHADGAAVQLPGGLEKGRQIEGRPQKPRRQTGQHQQGPGPSPAPPPDGKPHNNRRQNQRPAQGEQKGVQPAVDGEKDGGGKGEGKGG